MPSEVRRSWRTPSQAVLATCVSLTLSQLQRERIKWSSYTTYEKFGHSVIHANKKLRYPSCSLHLIHGLYYHNQISL